jgi:hypothetical protein
MNYKPGDLAVTFGAPTDNGLLVEVGEEVSVPEPEFRFWGRFYNVTSLGSPFHIDPGVREQSCYWPGRLLRPIRDPGDDAKDEMLRPLPHEVTA